MTTLDMTPDATPTRTAPTKTAPTWFRIAAWSVPALIAGDFLAGDVGWYAVIPVAAMLVGTLTNPAIRALRWWVGAMTALLAIPFLYDTESGAGIMADMHPVNLALFGVATLVVLAKMHRSHR